MLLLAKRQLDHAVGRNIRRADQTALVGNGGVVDAHRAALNMTAGFTIGGGKAGLDDEGTSIMTKQGDQVLAVDAKNELLLCIALIYHRLALYQHLQGSC